MVSFSTLGLIHSEKMEFKGHETVGFHFTVILQNLNVTHLSNLFRIFLRPVIKPFSASFYRGEVHLESITFVWLPYVISSSKIHYNILNT